MFIGFTAISSIRYKSYDKGIFNFELVNRLNRN